MIMGAGESGTYSTKGAPKRIAKIWKKAVPNITPQKPCQRLSCCKNGSGLIVISDDFRERGEERTSDLGLSCWSV